MSQRRLRYTEAVAEMIVLLGLAACSHQPTVKKSQAPAEIPKSVEVPKPANNFVVVTYEVVARADEDALVRTQIYADGQPIGQTESGPKSYKKKWEGFLAPGNHLIRCERWAQEGIGNWVKDDKAKDWERFVRIEDNQRATLEIKYFNNAQELSYDISREAIAPPVASTPAPAAPAAPASNEPLPPLPDP